MGNIDFVIVGLGNPGKQYDKTRHNVGFMALDYISKKLNAEFNTEKFHSLCATAGIGNKKVLLLKPQTFMNLSGKAVQGVMSFYKILPEKILIIFDDISIPVGKMRIKRKGTHGGHNGMRNIIELCDSQNFSRIKIGVGERPNPKWDLADWVLSKFDNSEISILEKLMPNVYYSIEMIVQDKIDEAMNRFN